MTSEKELIPYAPGELPPGPWLVFAPHPDDESFGMGGTLIRARDTGVEVDVVFVTDGALGGNGAPSEVAAERREEALSACRYLNIRHCYFWQQPDRRLRHDGALVGYAAALARQTRPGSVFIPGCMELHPDHRATARIVWDGLQQWEGFDGRVLGYEICTQGPINLLLDITGEVETKRHLMEQYPSQTSSGRYLDVIESLDRARAFTLPGSCRAAEGYLQYRFSRSVSYEQAALPWLQRYLQRPDWYASRLVSIVVRTRNRREYLSQALSSIAAQDYPRIELVVVNDGGEDVADLVKDLGRNLEACRTAGNAECQGRSRAANQGLELVSGDYFLFLDDDDWLDPGHVSNLVRTIEAEPGALVAYAGVRCIEPGRTKNRAFNEPFDRNRMFYENYIPINAALVSRTVIGQGVRFDEALEVFEDWDFWLQLMQRTIAFVHSDEITANYRIGRHHGTGVHGGHDEARRLIYARWSKTWGIAEIDDLLTRLAAFSRKEQTR